ncbi:hypothetical protein DK389_16215 [Methylobacterium durans]|uniref:Peptidase M50 domain-containing protein n=2 Tax=Methylobacterium durans TaxID=2202825 RepID=A0A2U8W6Q3_9HYPH|nr:hypothetical protein DK389_16215 [Methylobacterium durans]
MSLTPRHFRGRLSYVLHQELTNQFLRLSPRAHRLAGLMDGQRTVEQLLLAGDNVERATRQEMIHLLTQLATAGALAGNVPPDLAQLTAQASEKRWARRFQKLTSPLFVKVPLVDPDALLTRASSLARWLFQPLAGILWAIWVVFSLLQIAKHWIGLSSDIVDHIFSAENMVLVLLTIPLVKLVHEFGHALAVKAWGGEVHELGVMFMIFVPMPYVDATNSLRFPSKWQRTIVGAAGIMAEFILAGLALQIWLAVGPGLVRALAFNILVICTVSTLLFNGNPLLKYDAYYILSDIIEIPNLAQRASQQWLRWLRGWISGETAPGPRAPVGERVWCALYAPASLLYRVVLSIGIALVLAKKYFGLGVLLALWSVVTSLLLPTGRALAFVLRDPATGSFRRAGVVRGALILGALLVLLFLVEIPNRTLTQGVLKPGSGSEIIAEVDGFVERLLVSQGETVLRGEPLLVFTNDIVQHDRRLRTAELEALKHRRTAALAKSLVDAAIVEHEIGYASEKLALASVKVEQLAVRSPAVGVVELRSPATLFGRYVPRGELLGYVLTEATTVRALLAEEDVDLARSSTQRVLIRIGNDGEERLLPARLGRIVPAGARELPSAVLGTSGGGNTASDPTRADGRRALTTFFEAEVILEKPLAPGLIGRRVDVLLDHGWATPAWHLARAVKLLFLKELKA